MDKVAQDLLNMIENVSPDDTTKLDEIDAQVWCYIFNRDYEKHERIECPNDIGYDFG